jgi:glyoxylase-like metal-dependent hydrolase (beta-lactamase superfamily II)
VVRQIAEDVWVRQAVDNCTWAVLGDGVVIVDALEEPELADEVLQRIQETAGKPVSALVITHWHGDHTACNAAFRRAGARIIAQQEAARRRRNGPDISFATKHELRGDDRRVELRHVGGVHTPEDTCVHFPWAKVLCVGDLFGWGLIPAERLTPASSSRLLPVMQRLISYEAETVVPGHGPTATTEHLRRWVDYFLWLSDEVAARRKQGEDADAIKRALPIPDDMRDWWRIDWKHPHNIEQIAHSLA